MSGLATCEILRRQFEVHGDARFERLADVSRSHVYNLRASRTYRTRRTTWEKTRPSPVAIGVRKAPEPNGRPGFPRVDTVHMGDRDGRKGVCVVNVVDEVRARRRVHQVEAAALQRQRPGRGQERPRGAQASGPRPHPRPLRRRRGPVRPRAPVAVPQLPPPLPVRHRARGRQGQGAAADASRRLSSLGQGSSPASNTRTDPSCEGLRRRGQGSAHRSAVCVRWPALEADVRRNRWKAHASQAAGTRRVALSRSMVRSWTSHCRSSRSATPASANSVGGRPCPCRIPGSCSRPLPPRRKEHRAVLVDAVVHPRT